MGIGQFRGWIVYRIFARGAESMGIGQFRGWIVYRIFARGAESMGIGQFRGWIVYRIFAEHTMRDGRQTRGHGRAGTSICLDNAKSTLERAAFFQLLNFILTQKYF